MSRDSPLVRQWMLLGSLCARHQGMTVREMAEEMAVDERTIRRDLEVFARTGFPPRRDRRCPRAKEVADRPDEEPPRAVFRL